MSLSKFAFIVLLSFAAAFGMNWLLNGDLKPIASSIVAIGVVSGVLIGDFYRRHHGIKQSRETGKLSDR